MKSHVLPPFNNGRAFQLLLVTKDHQTRYAIQDTRFKDCLWLELDIHIRKFEEFDKVELIDLKMPSPEAYSEFVCTIGGVGKHIRWKTVFPQVGRKTSPDLLVSGIHDRAAFETVAETLKPFAFIHVYHEVSEEECAAHISITDSKYVGNVAAAFHAQGYGAIPVDEKFEETCGKMGIERKDRSDHMWWNQTSECAGPLRDIHRWDYSFVPDHWTKIPFTWMSMADNIRVNVSKLTDIPLPLRYYVVESTLRRLQTEQDLLRDEYEIVHPDEMEEIKNVMHSVDEEKKEWLECTNPKHYVTCRLTRAQNIQLLAATYWRTIAPFDCDTLHLSKLLAFRYCMFGYEGREVGAYRQKANYLGHGANIRKFKHHQQYKPENIPIEVLNKVYQKNGKLRGSGFKGTRGKYGHRDFHKYAPKILSKRSREAEDRIRASKTNCFEEYAKHTKSDLHPNASESSSHA